MSYHQLNINERCCIYQFLKLGMNIREIAKALHKNPSIISREIKRNNHTGKKMYHPNSTQNKYINRRLDCHRQIKLDTKMKEYIEDKINDR